MQCNARLIGQKLDQREIGRSEIDVLSRDGRRISLEVGGRILFEDGRVSGVFEIARDIHILYSEDVYAYHHSKVHQFRAKRIEAEASDPTHLEVDGEPLGKLPLEATVLSNCLRVIVPAGSPLLSKKAE